MLKKKITRLLRMFVVKTSFSPFSYFYKACYLATLKIVVCVLKGLPEIKSVYLTGGLASGRLVPGLSDIDLFLFVKGSDLRVRRIFRVLNIFFPLLGKDELAVYDFDEVSNIFDTSRLGADLFLNYSFLPSSNRVRHLYGERIGPFAEKLPELRPDMKLGWLSYLWGVVIKHIIFNRYAGWMHLNHTCLKLRRQMSFANESLAPFKIPFFAPGLVEQTYDWCRNEMFKAGKQYGWPQSISENREELKFGDLEILVTEPNKRRLATFKEKAPVLANGKIASILFGPSSFLELNEERLCVFIIEKEPLSLAETRELLYSIGPNDFSQWLEVYLLGNDIALSIQWISNNFCAMPVYWPFMSPLLFLYLSKQEAAIYGKPLQLSQKEISGLTGHYYKKEKSLFADLNRKISRFIKHPNMARLPASDFQLFFWQALQLFAYEKEKKRCFSSKQLCRHFCTIKDLDWLSDFHNDFLRDLSGDKSDTERFFQPSLELLHGFYRGCI